MLLVLHVLLVVLVRYSYGYDTQAAATWTIPLRSLGRQVRACLVMSLGNSGFSLVQNSHACTSEVQSFDWPQRAGSLLDQGSSLE